jgi:hypothetical protein
MKNLNDVSNLSELQTIFNKIENRVTALERDMERFLKIYNPHIAEINDDIKALKESVRVILQKEKTPA